MTTTLCGMRKIAPLKWAIPVLTALVLALAIGCSGEPQVVVVENEVVCSCHCYARTAHPVRRIRTEASTRRPAYTNCD